MKIITEEVSPELQQMNEKFFKTYKELSPRITNSVYYVKLKYLLFNEIIKYCKEKIELRNDLLNIQSYVGDFMSEEDIRSIFNDLKNKYNEQDTDNNICIEYHVESTHIDYGVCLFTIIKRGETMYVKKFIFRFRKGSAGTGLDLSGISNGGTLEPRSNDPKYVAEDILDLLGGGKNV